MIEVETMRRFLPTSLLAMVTATGLAACGSSSSGSSGGSGAVSASQATVSSKKVPAYGTVLVNSSGQALYMLTSDPSGSSKCTGACATAWPPLAAKGSPTAGPGANGSMLSTFTRSDGSKQVLYNHHALYTYAHAGLVSGEGVASQGGIFYLVAPTGKPVTKTSSGGY
jgi:predicted lipoprotein with Yx(FWY)xxD motif